MKREFIAFTQDELWLTDITEHPTDEGKLYTCIIKDVFSNRIVGWSIAGHMRDSLCVNALRSAVLRRNPASTIVHSDRGSQFRSKAFVQELDNNDLTGSMGRVGACGDNAAMESFNALLQNKRIGSQALANACGTATGNRVLDRAHLQPTKATTHFRKMHTCRIRNNQPTSRSGLRSTPNNRVNQTWGRPRRWVGPGRTGCSCAN